MAKKSVKHERYLVLRDTSEKQGHGWWFDESDACRGTESRNLYTADYSLDGYYDNKHFVIERKRSATELVANICHKEKWADFKQELERLEEFHRPFVICEFPFYEIAEFPDHSGLPARVKKQIKVRPPFLLKRLQEIWVRFKTPFLFCEHAVMARDVASGLFKRIVENGRPQSEAA